MQDFSRAFLSLIWRKSPSRQPSDYGAHASVGGEKTILVYDLGGGTFDATILHVSAGWIYASSYERGIQSRRQEFRRSNHGDHCRAISTDPSL